MAQSDFAEKIELDVSQIKYTDVMTGDKNKNRYLYYQLKISMLQAENIDIIVSFLMESGVRMILDDLKAALARGAKVRILTGNYLGITQKKDSINLPSHFSRLWNPLLQQLFINTFKSFFSFFKQHP